MENRLSRLSALAVLACALAMLACALLSPSQAQAGQWDGCYVQDSSGNRTYYWSQQEGINNACGEGKVVVLNRTETFLSTKPALSIPAGQNVTINMNGHTLKNDYSSVFLLNANSTLTLQSCDPDGKADSVGKQFAAGEISACYPASGGGIYMSEGSHLTLDNVTIKKNRASSYGGGIFAQKNCTIDLKNKSSIDGNTADDNGGGIYIGGENVKVTLDDSKICNNDAEKGGGIYIDAKGAVIDLKNGSSIGDNVAYDGGGGIYCNVSYFTIKSSDETGVISGNKAKGSSTTTSKSGQSGGGVHVDAKSGDNEGLIEGLTISDNYSAYDGGGLELDQRKTTVRNCTITGNTCKYEGGGIYDCNKDNTIDGCTITGNACSVDSGGNYEGGGVYVWCDYDLKLAGTCVIKGNIRGKDSGNADDVMLRENAGATAKAYITGSLAKGSTVGVRTGITGDRRIAKNFKPETKDCLFYDLDGYYVSYGSDEGGDAWQRHREIEFLAQVNGEGSNRYKWNSPVTLVVPLAKGDDRLFWCWDSQYTTGLNPVGDYITKDNVNSNTLAFKMPQNDVDANAVYATRATKVALGIEAPVAGEDLPASAVVQRADGIGGAQQFTAAVTWYEVVGGKEVPAAGKAKAGTQYRASVTCAQSQQGGLCFSKSINADGVTVKATSGCTAPEAKSASVDSATGALTVVTGAFDKTAGEKPATQDKKVAVKTVKGELKDAASGGTQTASEEPMLLSLDSDDQQDGFEVSCAADSESVTITAPSQKGYNFNHWEGVPDGVDYKDTDGYVTIPKEKLTEGLQLTAVYTPAVTEAEVGMDAPTAGQKLATSVSSLVLTGTDGSTLDFVKDVLKKDCPVTWSPEAAGEDGGAGYSTAYTALIELGDAEGLEDVDKVLDQGAVVKASDGTAADAAGFTVQDGKLYLAVTFPVTAVAKATGITQPADVELTFEQAKACFELGIWPLASSVDVAVQSGVAAEGDVEWQAVEGFDANAAAAQELAAHGTVTRIATADGSEIDANGLSREVTCMIKVAAPAQGGDEGDGRPAAGDADNKSALAKTGDSIPVFAVAAVAAVAVIAIAAAAVAACLRRG